MVAPLSTLGLRNLLLAAETFLLLRLWWLCAENNRTAGAIRQIKDPKKTLPDLQAVARDGEQGETMGT